MRVNFVQKNLFQTILNFGYKMKRVCHSFNLLLYLLKNQKAKKNLIVMAIELSYEVWKQPILVRICHYQLFYLALADEIIGTLLSYFLAEKGYELL